MTGNKRVACFFTAGYTELNSMKLFIKKINSNVEYIQLCPTGKRKSKLGIKNRHINSGIAVNQSGLTGKALINYIFDFIDKPAFIREKYDAILIEDDKDDRFLSIQPDGTATIDKGAWNQYKTLVQKKLHAKLQCKNMPVLFLYAAPEVEAWFLADWNNSFGNVYKDILTGPQNSYFNSKFRSYVQNNILKNQYCKCIESYGYFDNAYKKLSTEIQNALQTTDFLSDYKHGINHKTVYYSKRLQGPVMLENIDPQIVLHNCSYFFKTGLLELQDL